MCASIYIYIFVSYIPHNNDQYQRIRDGVKGGVPRVGRAVVTPHPWTILVTDLAKDAAPRPLGLLGGLRRTPPLLPSQMCAALAARFLSITRVIPPLVYNTYNE